MPTTYDITILTDNRFMAETYDNPVDANVIIEDGLLQTALEEKGLRVHRINWDHPTFDWSSTRYVVFRTTWDYSDRFEEFEAWLSVVSKHAKLINSKDLIYWNIDKFYLQQLEQKGIPIPATLFIEKGTTSSLRQLVEQTSWTELILKPSVSAGGRHTYRFNRSNVHELEAIFAELIANERMLLQEFQESITSDGEVSFMIFGGTYSHSVLKKAKSGDFRVQDDFGGTVHDYHPTTEEVEFAEKAFKACPSPVYARVDVMRNNHNELCVGEIELIEPELWFRLNDQSAHLCADAIKTYIDQTS